MSLYHAAEILIVSAAVGASAWALAVRLLPRLRRNRSAAGKDSGCSSCASCSGCGSQDKTPAPTQQPIRFQPRSR